MTKSEYYKDGLHILIGMKLKHDMQQLLRREVLKIFKMKFLVVYH